MDFGGNIIRILFYVFGIIFLFFLLVVVPIRSSISKKYNSEEHTKFDKTLLKRNAKIVNIEHKVVGYKPHTCFRTIVTFDDGFQYISHDTKIVEGFLGYNISVPEEMKTGIMKKAIREHFNAISNSSLLSFRNAYLRLKDYADGLYDDESPNNHGRLFLVNYQRIIFCLGWCIFHANTEKQNKVLYIKQRCNSKLRSISNGNPENIEELIKKSEDDYVYMAKEMLKFKKEHIDPLYLQDKSKENYDFLLGLFLELVCKLINLEWYDGIIEDFKHCMDE